MRRTGLIVLLILMGVLRVAAAQSAGDLKVAVEEIATFRAPNIFDNAELKSLPKGGNWVKPPAYRWFVMNGAVSKNLRFPANFAVTISQEKDNSVTVRAGDKSFRQTKIDDLEEIVASPDASMVMFLYSEMFGDISRYRVRLLDLKTGKEDLITAEPVGLAEFSPNSKYILVEGLDLVDASVETRTSITLGKFNYPEVLAWSKDGSQLVLLEYENWQGPQFAKKYLITLK